MHKSKGRSFRSGPSLRTIRSAQSLLIVLTELLPIATAPIELPLTEKLLPLLVPARVELPPIPMVTPLTEALMVAPEVV